MSERARVLHGLLLAAALFTAAPRHASASVRVVDAAHGPGSEFTDIQSAIAAASDGDVIYVRAGTYASFTIDAKALTVIGDPAGGVAINAGSISIRNVAAAQSVLVRGFDVLSGGMFSDTSILQDCLGPLWIEDCTFLNAVGPFSPMEALPDGLVIVHCASVTLARCTATGTHTRNPAGVGLRATDSTINAYDDSFVGGAGIYGNGGNGAAPPGGDAFVLTGGSLFASGTTIRGGEGGHGIKFCAPTNCWCFEGGDGGDGLVLGGSAPLARVLDCTLAGGAGGPPGQTCTQFGATGQGSVVGAGSLTELLGEQHSLQALSPVCEQTSTEVVLAGAPGELAFLLESPAQGHAFIPALGGVLLVAQPAFVVAVGTLPASGVLQLSFPIGNVLPPAIASANLYLQSAFVSGPHAATLGAPSALVVFNQPCP